MKRYILTGTPGCGKTTILRALIQNMTRKHEKNFLSQILWIMCPVSILSTKGK